MRGLRADVEEQQTIFGGAHIMFLNLRNTVLIVAATLVAQASAVPADTPFIRAAKEVKWGALPPVFPPGAKFAVIAGDPTATGLVTVRFEMPAGYKIPPHFHPTDEHVTALKGSFSLGMGDVIDKAHALTLSPGGYGVAMANMHHYAYTTTGATIQVQLAAIEWQKLHQALRPVFMPLGHVVFEPNVQREHVYFPTTSIISFSYMLTGGGSAECAVIGNDGLVGVAVLMGGGMMPRRAIVQSEGGTRICPKGLNPGKSIANIKRMLLERRT